MRIDGRKENELRKVSITKGNLLHLPGSVSIEVGNTKVICAATMEDRIPPFLKGSGQGWIKAEYGMLPCSAPVRIERESTKGRIQGRTHEIQRLIGRSLRAIVDLRALGERTLRIDCDVIQADGGTRTTSINGAFVAIVELLKECYEMGMVNLFPVWDFVAAISVGIVDGKALLDLNYAEDSKAAVDLNLVMTGKGKLVEIQGTAEGAPFSFAQLEELLGLAKEGIKELVEIQKMCISRCPRLF